MIGKVSYRSKCYAAIEYNNKKVRSGSASVLFSSKDIAFPENSQACLLAMSSYVEKKTNMKTPYYHISLNFSPKHHYTDDEMEKYAKEYLEKMGYDKSCHIAYVHNDRGHQHIHIVGVRTRNERYEIKKSVKICQEITKKYKLDNNKKVSAEAKKRIDDLKTKNQNKDADLSLKEEVARDLHKVAGAEHINSVEDFKNTFNLVSEKYKCVINHRKRTIVFRTKDDSDRRSIYGKDFIYSSDFGNIKCTYKKIEEHIKFKNQNKRKLSERQKNQRQKRIEATIKNILRSPKCVSVQDFFSIAKEKYGWHYFERKDDNGGDSFAFYDEKRKDLITENDFAINLQEELDEKLALRIAFIRREAERSWRRADSKNRRGMRMRRVLDDMYNQAVRLNPRASTVNEEDISELDKEWQEIAIAKNKKF